MDDESGRESVPPPQPGPTPTPAGPGRKPMATLLVWTIDIVIGAAVALLVVYAVGKFRDDDSDASTASSPSSTQVPGGSTANTAARPLSIDPKRRYTATIETSEGTIVVALATKDAPRSVDNFVVLARKGFYNGLVFHRVVKGFVVQGGDPLGNGTGGSGTSVAVEPASSAYTVGDLAWANTQGEDSIAGSQFFIVSGPAGEKLPLTYGKFGHVTKGADIVAKLDSYGTGIDDPVGKPSKVLTIKKVTITEG